MKYNLKKNKSCEISLVVTFDKEDLDYYVNEAQKNLANNLKIEGFRKGKVPLEVAKDKLDKNEVLKIAFDLAFRQSFSDILFKEKLELIDASKFEVKENSSDMMVYSVILIIFPEFKVADYHDMRIKRNAVSVSEEEIDKTAESIRDSRKKDGVIPELNDEFARNLGQFNDLKEFRVSIGEGLKQEKEIKESQRIQSAILDKIAEKTKVESPSLLIERQLDQMMLELDADLHRQGLELGLFLAKIKKTKDALRSEWKPKAELLVKKALIIKEISKKENIKTDEQEVKEKMNQLLQGFGNPEQAEKNIDLPKLAEQMKQIILNQKVLVFLEKKATQN
ncbi:MAG: trigger factor [Patescibacteria group bacterium]